MDFLSLSPSLKQVRTVPENAECCKVELSRLRVCFCRPPFLCFFPRSPAAQLLSAVCLSFRVADTTRDGCSWCRRLGDSMMVGMCCARPKRSMRAAAMARRLVMAIFLACLVRTRVVGASAEGEVVNTQVQRKIDVSTQFAKVRLSCLLSVKPSLVLPAACCRHLCFERCGIGVLCCCGRTMKDKIPDQQTNTQRKEPPSSTHR